MLRNYQLHAVNAIDKRINDQGVVRGVVGMPTGSGKSHVIAELFNRYPDDRFLVLSHRKEILKQNARKSSHEIGFYSAGLREKCLDKRIIMASVQSFYRLKKEVMQSLGLRFIVIDECHIVNQYNDKTQYMQIINTIKLRNENINIIGLTAAPYRRSSGSIVGGKVFKYFIYNISDRKGIINLIKKGYLTKLEAPKKNQIVSLRGVSMFGGDFSMIGAEKRLEPKTLDAVANSLTYIGERKKALVFCTTINHAIYTQTLYENLGYQCAIVHGKLTPEQRKYEINLFTNKSQYKVCVNVDVLTVGFDFPQIDTLIYLRPTASKVFWTQTLGRGMRIANNKTSCLVLDYVGNISRMKGFFSSVSGGLGYEIKETRTGEVIKKDDERTCSNCHNRYIGFACTHCGSEPISLKEAWTQALPDDTSWLRIYSAQYYRHTTQKGYPAVKIVFDTEQGNRYFYLNFDGSPYGYQKAVDYMIDADQKRMFNDMLDHPHAITTDTFFSRDYSTLEVPIAIEYEKGERFATRCIFHEQASELIPHMYLQA